MDQKILCILQICINPTNNASNRGLERIEQYKSGLNKFFEYIDVLKKYNVDIIIFENTIKKDEKIPSEILKIIPNNVTIINENINDFGTFNKGAGLMETWSHLKHIIEKYEYLIHFEPRQLLLNFDFIQDFLYNPRNLFTISPDGIQFNTGLFCISCSVLLDFTEKSYKIITSVSYNIEYLLFLYFKKLNISYSLRDNMGLIWFPFLSQPLKM